MSNYVCDLLKNYKGKDHVPKNKIKGAERHNIVKILRKFQQILSSCLRVLMDTK